MIIQKNIYMDIVNAVLYFTQHEDTQVVSQTFTCWFALSELLSERGAYNDFPLWQPVFTQLLKNCIQHVQFPPNSAQSPSERDAFREFRYSVGDVIKDCVVVLGETSALQIPLSTLTSPTWETVEASLFTIRLMASHVSSQENTCIPYMMQLLPTLPPHPKIKHASVMCIGRYAFWTREHPEYISQHLSLITHSIADVDACSASSQALKHMCEAFPEKLIVHLKSLTPFFHMCMSSDIGREDKEDVCVGISCVVGEMEQGALLSLQEMILPTLQALHEIAYVPIKNINDPHYVNKVKLIKGIHFMIDA